MQSKKLIQTPIYTYMRNDSDVQMFTLISIPSDTWIIAYIYLIQHYMNLKKGLLQNETSILFLHEFLYLSNTA
jgi:hypothetical protein